MSMMWSSTDFLSLMITSGRGASGRSLNACKIGLIVIKTYFFDNAHIRTHFAFLGFGSGGYKMNKQYFHLN